MKDLAARALAGMNVGGMRNALIVDDVAAALRRYAADDSRAVQEVAAARLADAVYLARIGVCPLSRSAAHVVAYAREHVAAGGRVAL